MKVQEIMERTGMRNASKCIAYIKDALNEIQLTYPNKTERATIDIVDGTRYYSLPSNCLALKGVYRKYDDDGRYQKIKRVVNVEMLEDDSATSVSGADVIVI